MQRLKEALNSANAVTISSIALAQHISHMIETEPEDKHDFSLTDAETIGANSKKLELILRSISNACDTIGKSLERYYNDYTT